MLGCVAFRPRSFNLPVAAKRRKRTTEPDLDLIKQVEQVATLVLEGPARRVLPYSEHGNHGAVVIPRIADLPMISFADISLQKQRKQLVLRSNRMIQRTPPPRFPGESRDPFLPWTPASAGEAGLKRRASVPMHRANESEHLERPRGIGLRKGSPACCLPPPGGSTADPFLCQIR